MFQPPKSGDSAEVPYQLIIPPPIHTCAGPCPNCARVLTDTSFHSAGCANGSRMLLLRTLIRREWLLLQPCSTERAEALECIAILFEGVHFTIRPRGTLHLYLARITGNAVLVAALSAPVVGDERHDNDGATAGWTGDQQVAHSQVCRFCRQLGSAERTKSLHISWHCVHYHSQQTLYK